MLYVYLCLWRGKGLLALEAMSPLCFCFVFSVFCLSRFRFSSSLLLWDLTVSNFDSVFGFRAPDLPTWCGSGAFCQHLHLLAVPCIVCVYLFCPSGEKSFLGCCGVPYRMMRWRSNSRRRENPSVLCVCPLSSRNASK